MLVPYRSSRPYSLLLCTWLLSPSREPLSLVCPTCNNDTRKLEGTKPSKRDGYLRFIEGFRARSTVLYGSVSVQDAVGTKEERASNCQQ